MHIVPVALIAVLLVGCSSQPTSSSATAPPATTPAAAPATAETAAAPEVVAGSTAGQRKAPPGYKPVKRDGQMFYCRKVTEPGTRFTKTQCMTPDEYEEYERNGAALRQEMQRKANICSNPGGSCGG